MRAYIARHLDEYATGAGTVTANLVSDIVAYRSHMRRRWFGGGQCHNVANELLEAKAWLRFSVAYLSRCGEVICADHSVNVLADGTIIDCTADQFGEGHDVRIVPPHDPEYGRYRPSFSAACNPESSPSLAAWEPDWGGAEDTARACDMQMRVGYGWWVDDPSDLLAYARLERAKALAEMEDADLGLPKHYWGVANVMLVWSNRVRNLERRAEIVRAANRAERNLQEGLIHQRPRDR